MINYKGTEWYKCDLHLHTTASECFKDKNITPKDWVNEAIAKNLDCVAVTDHNSGKMIDEIKTAAEGTGLTVFPGVEITCDTSKIHFLVLLDPSKSSEDIQVFLIQCGILPNVFGKTEAHTSKNIFEVAEIAYNLNAVIIPAHIDEYNGLGTVSAVNLKKLFELEYINAVQVVHKEFLNSDNNINSDKFKNYLNEYYGNPKPSIGDSDITNYKNAINLAQKNKLALLTFSDNPSAVEKSKHGLDGIGKKYTWIKMDTPSIEGLRQAFLLPKFRIRNCFDSESIPYKTPKLWIKSISILNTQITGEEKPLKIDFSPQLTTIIGGRGSGKSSIIRLIRGLFGRIDDIKDLKDIIDEYNDFYKKYDAKTKKGILNDDSTIEIEFIRNDTLYRIKTSEIKKVDEQNILIEKFNNTTQTFHIIPEIEFLDFFEYEMYLQKQVYETAKTPNALINCIDNSIKYLKDLINEKEYIKKQFLEKCNSIRVIENLLSNKGRIQTEINDLESSIDNYKKSSEIKEILDKKILFDAESRLLKKLLTDCKNKNVSLRKSLLDINVSNIDISQLSKNYLNDIFETTKEFKNNYQSISDVIETKIGDLDEMIINYENQLNKSKWNSDYNNLKKEFEKHKKTLEASEIEDLNEFEDFIIRKEKKENELNEINELEKKLYVEIKERTNLQNKYFEITKEITKLRHKFIMDTLQDDKIKISILGMKNTQSYIESFRNIIQKEKGFDKEFEDIETKLTKGKPEDTVKKISDLMYKIKNNEETEFGKGTFRNMIKKLNDTQLDEIELLLPEDEIRVEYKKTDSSLYEPLAVASAGQKTTAILTFILSHGKVPLILDQPEDDLDNRLVYELIVDRLRRSKEFRQIIVVTHNANIPVNGDAEYIISMDSKSEKISVFKTGTVEDNEIKKEICDVMEGTQYAFQMRRKRYESID
jgi:ABC-type Mn2+/Zn2+ transport system ATPase subunit